jgi:hypothetical protein
MSIIVMPNPPHPAAGAVATIESVAIAVLGGSRISERH